MLSFTAEYDIEQSDTRVPSLWSAWERVNSIASNFRCWWVRMTGGWLVMLVFMHDWDIPSVRQWKTRERYPIVLLLCWSRKDRAVKFYDVFEYFSRPSVARRVSSYADLFLIDQMRTRLMCQRFSLPSMSWILQHDCRLYVCVCDKVDISFGRVCYVFFSLSSLDCPSLIRYRPSYTYVHFSTFASICSSQSVHRLFFISSSLLVVARRRQLVVLRTGSWRACCCSCRSWWT